MDGTPPRGEIQVTCGDPARQHLGRAVLCRGPVQSGPLPHGWGPFHIEPTFTHRGGAQRRGSITCFSRQEGWTDFYPKRRNETRLPGPFHYQDLSGVVLTRCRLLSVYVIICLKCEFMCGSRQFCQKILSVFLHSTTRRTIETLLGPIATLG